jgi:tetratricopeptide (TPR) repeat protein
LPLTASPEQRTAVGVEILRLLVKRWLLREAKDMLHTVEAALPAATRGQFLLALGKLALQDGQAAAAVQYLQQGQELLPTPGERAELLTLLGEGLLARGQEAEGSQALQRCAEVTTASGQKPLPQAETCLFRTARLQGTQRQPQLALATYQALLQTFPSTAYRGPALLHMAELAQTLDDAAQEQKTLTTLRDNAPSDFWYKLAADALEEVAWRKQFHERLAEFQNRLSN